MDKKKPIVFLLVFCFLLFVPVQADSITYNPSTDTITVTGYSEFSPCNFSLLYDADLAGSLQLLPPTSAGQDLSLSRQVQPADSLALKLNLNVTNLQAGNWLSGWSYRKQITITGQSGAGTNYQVLLKVGESSGSSGVDFHVESHCTDFPNDIRFTDNDGTTLLDHWLEKTEGTSPNRVAWFWVEVADDLGSNVDVYIYYGKSGEGSASNGDNTFIFFDDFESGTLDKWSTLNGEVIDDGAGNLVVRLIAGTTDNIGATISHTDVSLDFKYQHKAVGGYGPRLSVRIRRSDGNNFYAGRTEVEAFDYGHKIVKIVAGTYTKLADNNVNTYTLDVWYDNYMRATGTDLSALIAQGPALSATDDSFSSGPTFEFLTWDTGNILWLDNIRLRKFVDPEPSFSSVGNEETGEASVSLTGKDKDDNAQTETVDVSANTTYTTSKWWRSIDPQGVDCVGTFTLEITQPRWGAIWKEENSYTTKGITIHIGDETIETWYADENIQIQTYSDSQIEDFFRVRNNGHFRLGKLLDETEKIVSSGVSIKSINCLYILFGDSGSTIEIYDSYIAEVGGAYLADVTFLGGSNTTIYNSKFSGIQYGNFLGVAELYDVEFKDIEAVEIIQNAGTSIEKLEILNTTDCLLYIKAPEPTITNLYGRQAALYSFYVYETLGDDVYLIDADLDAWTFYFEDVGDTKVYRQYTFDLTISYPNGTTIPNANVTISHCGENAGQDYSGQTDANGQIPTQTLTMGFYNSTGGNTIFNYNPYTLTVTKDGYQTYSKNFTLTEKTDWTIALQQGDTSITNLVLAGFASIMFTVGTALVIVRRKRNR